MTSWANPKTWGGHVGTVFFATNIAAPDSRDDHTVLTQLSEFYAPYVERGFSLVILGWADFRPTSYEGGNTGLARDRAEYTGAAMMQLWRLAGLDPSALHSFEKGLGVDPASHGTSPTDEALAGYRRADILVSPVALPPNVEPLPETEMSNTWRIDIENCTAISLSVPGLPLAGVKELFNAAITDERSGESLQFTFDGEGISAGPSLPNIPFDVSYRSGSARFTTVFNHTVNEFEGRIAHASGQLVTGVGNDVLVLDIKGGSDGSSCPSRSSSPARPSASRAAPRCPAT